MFAFVVKRLMEERDISIEKISELTNLDKEDIIKVVDNKISDAPLSTLYKISKVLGVDIKDLYYSADDYEKLRTQLGNIVAVFGVSDKRAKELSYILDILHNLKLKNNMIT